MFYQENMYEALRFGDVLRGFILTTPKIDEPIGVAEHKDYIINVSLPAFSVVLSPCCSIRDKIISLAPLIQLYGTFFDNPYFEKDLTNINRKMIPEQTVSPQIWGEFPEEEKQKRLQEGLQYALVNLFVYERHDFFPNYTIHRREHTRETDYYMIDFRHVYKVNCDKIITPENAPLDCKCLQLSIETRKELREKISSYYGRTPEEDKVLLES